jgi:hypothetical protein
MTLQENQLMVFILIVTDGNITEKDKYRFLQTQLMFFYGVKYKCNV